MLAFETMTLFFGAAVALALTPGPDNLFVLTQAAVGGRKAGLAVTLGLCSGLLVHTGAVALGVAALFATSALAFLALKLLGAAYLLYLAWGALTAKVDTGESTAADEQRMGALYTRGIAMNITNPKVAIFFLAFMPQFTDPSLGSVGLQIMTLGALFMVATLLVFGAVALGAGALGEWLQRSPRVQVVLNRTAGVVFILLAARLLTTQR